MDASSTTTITTVAASSIVCATKVSSDLLYQVTSTRSINYFYSVTQKSWHRTQHRDFTRHKTWHNLVIGIFTRHDLAFFCKSWFFLQKNAKCREVCTQKCQLPSSLYNDKASESILILSKRRAKSTKIGLKETEGNKVLYSSKMYKYIESVHASKFGHATISV